MAKKSRRDTKGRVLRTGESYRKNGLYSYAYTDPLGKRRYIYARELKDLREKEKELIKNQLDGLDLYAESKATLNITFDRYMSGKYNLRPNTRSNYMYLYNQFVRPDFGKKMIADVKYSDVKFYYLYLMKEKGLKPLTVDHIHTLLHPTFQMAVRDDIIRKNPTEGVMAEIKKEYGKSGYVRHALTVEQEKVFLNYIKDTPHFNHWLSLFTVLLGTGCRIGEALGLRWEDVDLEKREISINHTLVYFPDEKTRKTAYHISNPKTEAGIRIIPMFDEVYDAFKKELEFQKEHGFCEHELDGMSGFIFYNKNGMLQNGQTVNRAIKRIISAYNYEEALKAKQQRRKPVMLPDFSCHHLRHTFCTRMCENETNIKVIQAIMGHANFETTMDIYAEATEAIKKEVIEKLSESMKLF